MLNIRLIYGQYMVHDGEWVIEWISINWEVPQNGRFIKENTFKMDDLSIRWLGIPIIISCPVFIHDCGL